MTTVNSKGCPTCENTIWDVIFDRAKCTNCGLEREYKRRNHSTKLSKSQKAAIKRIRDYFSEWGRYNYCDRKEPRKLYRFEVSERSEFGTVNVIVQTHKSPYLMEGGHFFVGPRGKIQIASAYTLSDGGHRKAHYAKILHGHVWNV